MVLMNQLQLVSQNISDVELIPVACCSIEIFKTSVRNANATKCGKVDPVGFLYKIAKKLTDEVVDLVCGKIPKGLECMKKLRPEMGQNFETIENDPNLKDASFIGSLLKAVKNFSE